MAGPMNPADIASEVDQIIALNDHQEQHELEDALLSRIALAYAPAAIVTEVKRLAAAEFARRYE